MYQGRIVETGDTGRVFDHPVDPYTKLLIGSVPRLIRSAASDSGEHVSSSGGNA
jgi:ABC-type oligopeptide transport system ATPase subunit